MSAKVRSQYTREVFRNFQTSCVSYFVYDSNSPFAGTQYDRSAWYFIGNASIYTPKIRGDMTEVVISPNNLPSGRIFPQVYVADFHTASMFYQAYAETFLSESAIEAERAEWASAMANAEAAEVKARELLNPTLPPF